MGKIKTWKKFKNTIINQKKKVETKQIKAIKMWKRNKFSRMKQTDLFWPRTGPCGVQGEFGPFKKRKIILNNKKVSWTTKKWGRLQIATQRTRNLSSAVAEMYGNRRFGSTTFARVAVQKQYRFFRQTHRAHLRRACEEGLVERTTSSWRCSQCRNGLKRDDFVSTKNRLTAIWQTLWPRPMTREKLIKLGRSLNLRVSSNSTDLGQPAHSHQLHQSQQFLQSWWTQSAAFRFTDSQYTWGNLGTTIETGLDVSPQPSTSNTVDESAKCRPSSQLHMCHCATIRAMLARRRPSRMTLHRWRVRAMTSLALANGICSSRPEVGSSECEKEAADDSKTKPSWSTLRTPWNVPSLSEWGWSLIEGDTAAVLWDQDSLQRAWESCGAKGECQ